MTPSALLANALIGAAAFIALVLFLRSRTGKLAWLDRAIVLVLAIALFLTVGRMLALSVQP